MSRVVLACFAALAFVLSWPLQYGTPDWTRAVRLISHSTVPIACSLHERHICTAFSINETEGLYMTAHHCIQPVANTTPPDLPYIDKKPIVTLLANATWDIAIVKAAVPRPALQYRVEALPVGSEVGTYGYGYGLSVPIFRSAFVSAIVTYDNGSEWTMIDNALVRGMSGGPIVDRNGDVVGVNSMSDSWSGSALSLSQLRTATRFWE